MTSQEITQRTPEQQLVSTVRSDQFKEQVAMVLPPTVTLDRFVRIATTAIMTNPAIAQIQDQQSILRAFVQAAADGLVPDGKEGAIVGRGGKAVWQPMIYGVRKSAADYGWTITTKAVYAADVFEWSDEPPTRLHQPPRPGVDRGEIIGAYAVAKHTDGRELQMFMPWADIAKRRELATTKQVWDKWPAEMSEKTVGKALFADLPLAEADRERLARVFAAAAIEPAEATRLIYGTPLNETPAHLPAGVDAQQDETTASPQPLAEQSNVDTTQQAATAEQPSAAVAAPGPNDELDGEPGPEESPFQAPASAATDEDPAVFAAKFAGDVVVPIGQWQGHTLKQVHAAGAKGVSWFKYALKNFDAATGTTDKASPRMNPGELVQAIEAFTKVYLPDEWQAAMAQRELS